MTKVNKSALLAAVHTATGTVLSLVLGVSPDIAKTLAIGSLVGISVMWFYGRRP